MVRTRVATKINLVEDTQRVPVVPRAATSSLLATEIPLSSIKAVTIKVAINKALLVKSLPSVNREPNEHSNIELEIEAHSRQALTEL